MKEVNEARCLIYQVGGFRLFLKFIPAFEVLDAQGKIVVACPDLGMALARLKERLTNHGTRS